MRNRELLPAILTITFFIASAVPPDKLLPATLTITVFIARAVPVDKLLRAIWNALAVTAGAAKKGDLHLAIRDCQARADNAVKTEELLPVSWSTGAPGWGAPASYPRRASRAEGPCASPGPRGQGICWRACCPQPPRTPSCLCTFL